MTEGMLIRPLPPEEAGEAARIWNACVESGETLYCPLTETAFRRLFFSANGVLLAVERQGQLIGFAHANPPQAGAGKAFLTTVTVKPGFRGQGAGRLLLDEVRRSMAVLGAETLWVSSLNPTALGWRIPGTPGHGHNNMPGADRDAPGYGFLRHVGFEEVYLETAMYLCLADYKGEPGLSALRLRLFSEGVYTGLYSPAMDVGFDRLCDRVGSEYWRNALKTEIAAWKANRPNEDPAFWADGVPPKGPRPLLIAAREQEIIGFTGPVDVQENGRGWFTGICVDPAFQRRGIGKALFHLLLQSFRESGAAYASLFTGEDNPARLLYESAGFRCMRPFAMMRMALRENNMKKP